MPKYIKKLSHVEAKPYQKGMEEYWKIMYLGELSRNKYEYYMTFKTEEECWDFINNDLGKNECREIDKTFKIIYGTPKPYIKTIDGETHINKDDYILFLDNGTKKVMSKDIFEATYELE